MELLLSLQLTVEAWQAVHLLTHFVGPYKLEQTLSSGLIQLSLDLLLLYT